jgi:quercetin dioxygenase-like cupin family protein
MSDNPATLVRSAEQRPLEFPWGRITWLCSQEIDPEAAMTFGLVEIGPGQKNALHYHPNCEEHLYVLSGECDHSLDGEVYHLTAGSLIRIPQGARHDAVNRGAESVRCVIVYSAPDRKTVMVEE